MRVFKALRRSIKGEKDQKAPHISIAPKSAVAIVPPKKVCLASEHFVVSSFVGSADSIVVTLETPL